MSSSVLHLTQDGLFIFGDRDQSLEKNKYQEQNIEKTRQELHVQSSTKHLLSTSLIFSINKFFNRSLQLINYIYGLISVPKNRPGINKSPNRNLKKFLINVVADEFERKKQAVQLSQKKKCDLFNKSNVIYLDLLN